jgi:spore coat protein U-like protein
LTTKLNKLAWAIGALMMAGGAMAEDGNLAVDATVTAACFIGDGTLSLGSTNGLNADGTFMTGAAASRAASSDIVVSCTAGSVATIAFAAGSGARFAAGNWGIVGADSTTFLDFKLFDVSTGGTAITNAAGLAGVTSTAAKKIYGEVQYAGSALKPQAYSGTVVMTVAVDPG